MTRPLICMRCGHEGADVVPALVDLEAEYRAEGETVRDVEVELVTELRHVRDVTRLSVPERYGAEYRCRDRAACDARYRENEEPMAPVPAPPVDEEEEVPWL